MSAVTVTGASALASASRRQPEVRRSDLDRVVDAVCAAAGDPAACRPARPGLRRCPRASPPPRSRRRLQRAIRQRGSSTTRRTSASSPEAGVAATGIWWWSAAPPRASPRPWLQQPSTCAEGTRPLELHLYVIDLDAGLLPALDGLPQVGAAIASADSDRRARVLRFLDEEVAARRAGGRAGGRADLVLIVDDFAGLARAHDPVARYRASRAVRACLERGAGGRGASGGERRPGRGPPA